ncbi:hypothetical protein [Streptomyces sp. NPDC127197]|uniref:hypothetical protein n=1 Tax=Streptomyces sp. NPDC127197 TaxID=3345388 RepID=UPI00363F032F
MMRLRRGLPGGEGVVGVEQRALRDGGHVGDGGVRESRVNGALSIHLAALAARPGGSPHTGTLRRRDRLTERPLTPVSGS